MEDGIRMTWGRELDGLQPVPSDATELVIRILNIDTWQGPWEFRINLQD